METHTAIVLFALVAALGLVGVVVVDIMLTAQEAEAQKPRGCNRSVAANASQGRCVEPGKPG
jgi:Flp pilus assembly protein CpaB